MHPLKDHFRVASFFAGVGGIDLGFSLTRCQIVYANEFDLYAVKTYNLNFPHPADCRDIHAVKAEELPDMDILVGGFPCQAFSIAGLRQGCHDEKGRGSLFFELARILYAKKPRAAFFEGAQSRSSQRHSKRSATMSIIVSSTPQNTATFHRTVNVSTSSPSAI